MTIRLPHSHVCLLSDQSKIEIKHTSVSSSELSSVTFARTSIYYVYMYLYNHVEKNVTLTKRGANIRLFLLFPLLWPTPLDFCTTKSVPPFFQSYFYVLTSHALFPPIINKISQRLPVALFYHRIDRQERSGPLGVSPWQFFF